MVKKVKKRKYKVDKERLYNSFYSLYGDSIETDEGFEKAYSEYIGSQHQTKFTKAAKDHVKDKYFNRPEYKEKLGVEKNHHVTKQEIPHELPSKVKGGLKKPKYEYEYIGKQKDKSVYSRRSYTKDITGKRRVAFRDKYGRFTKVK